MANKNSTRVWAACELILWLGTVVIVTACVVRSPNASAEFYSRNDHLGRRHISNLPPHGFARNGEIRRSYDPNSIVYQHAQMLEALAAQSAAIAQSVEQDQYAYKTEITARRSPRIRRVPREGSMNLDDLIALEKRGGRWQSEVDDQP